MTLSPLPPLVEVVGLGGAEHAQRPWRLGRGRRLPDRLVLRAGDSGDTLDGAHRHDELYGGAGNDTLSGREATTRLDGGAGNDSVAGNDGNDELIGGAGVDALIGAAATTCSAATTTRRTST